MDFEKAIKSHSAWKTKISHYMKAPDGSLNAGEVALDNHCTLGQWLHTDGKQYANLMEYKELKACHAQFHACASHIVKRVESGEQLKEEVVLGPNSEYSKLSDDVAKLIMNMRSCVTPQT